MRDRKLLGMDVWAASGPGWANSGVTLIYERFNDGKRIIEQETVYLQDLPLEWHKVALVANGKLLEAAQKKLKEATNGPSG